MPEFTLSETKAVSEVRAAMAGLPDDMIPDETLEQAVFRFAKPWVERNIPDDETNEAVNSAVIAYAAELSFDAWFSKSRMRDRELEVFTQPRVWKDKLEDRTEEIFALYGISRPPKKDHIVEVTFPAEDKRSEFLE